jgi:predicted branched-subunit amino acid permease
MKHLIRDKSFRRGFIAIFPVMPGIIPFGAVMGVVCSEAKLTLFQTVAMNLLAYAGAAQLAAVELMTKHAAGLVVIATGLIVNIRFLLYSAALSPHLQRSSFFTKLFSAYTLTDQSYAVVSAHQSTLKDSTEIVSFYLGTAVCMCFFWHASVIAGFIFGNFAPAALALDYAVPLSFVALVIPTLKNKTYVVVAAFSSVVSILLYNLPFRIGLIATALLSIGVAIMLTQKRKQV